MWLLFIFIYLFFTPAAVNLILLDYMTLCIFEQWNRLSVSYNFTLLRTFCSHPHHRTTVSKWTQHSLHKCGPFFGSKWEKMLEHTVWNRWHVGRLRRDMALHNSAPFSWLRFFLTFRVCERRGFNVCFYSYAQEEMTSSIDQDNGEACRAKRRWFNKWLLGLNYTIPKKTVSQYIDGHISTIYLWCSKAFSISSHYEEKKAKTTSVLFNP